MSKTISMCKRPTGCCPKVDILDNGKIVLSDPKEGWISHELNKTEAKFIAKTIIESL